MADVRELRPGECQHAPRDSVLTPLGEVPVGGAGRGSGSDITTFDSSGIGLHDLHLYLYRGLAPLNKPDASL
ncbi:hypothetical protein GCM10010211_79990 [Streptomyces albospinus]|uniref:Uncharacterized protein n=1 Tax=Streptomyces albospinus TaxID=285515 RepID=A0ABQ2VNK9_9ACTN|nr:hypothetical protein [Streptomyces albospinus]GGV00688.1 hypothetical protein GCM10010211_79990 [Streptomyces albospinus]